MEREIGSTFKIKKHIVVQVVEEPSSDRCSICQYSNIVCTLPQIREFIGECSTEKRLDNMNVVFKIISM